MVEARRSEAEEAVYWLISAAESSGALVLDLADLGRSLPVFSFREEADLFLALGGLGGGWSARKSGAGDFLSLFFGPCADVRSIILDPLPAMLRDSTAGLVGLSVERFMDRFLDVPAPGGAPEWG